MSSKIPLTNIGTESPTHMEITATQKQKVVHYQRFGELLQHVYEWQDSQRVF